MAIDLQRPIRIERVRGFQPPWRSVAVYRCQNGHESRINLHSKYLPVGGVYCPQCKNGEKEEN